MSARSTEPAVVPEGRRMRDELVDSRIGHALRDLVELTLAIDPDHPHRPERR